jgi:hypothetical protein
MFLATTLYANKLLKDAAAERNLREIQAKINEMIDRINSGGLVTREEIEATMLAFRNGPNRAIGEAERNDESGPGLGPAGSIKSSE